MPDDEPAGTDRLRTQVEQYLRAHHTMTVATMGPTASNAGNAPHAASVFYAMDDSFRLVFLSKPSSLHGTHIGEVAPVAVTVSEDYQDWEMIRGVQLWGEARRLTGMAKTGALAVYLRRFPFVGDLLREPRTAGVSRNVAVYRIELQRAAFTDNTTGVFGRQVLELVVQ